eukprot:123556-Pelagomonas_calceolata.AAC.6
MPLLVDAFVGGCLCRWMPLLVDALAPPVRGPVPSSVSSWRLQAIITSLNAPVANKKPIQEAKF